MVVWCLQQSEGDTLPDACKVARALGVPGALRSAVWRVAQVSGQTAAPLLHPPAAALGEGAAGAGGAGVPAHCAVAGHLARGVSIAGDNGAGVPALVAKKNIHDILRT